MPNRALSREEAVGRERRRAPCAIAWNTVRTPTRNTVCRAPDEAVKVPHTDAITSSPPLAC
ncbi:hypothetical protein GQ56_0123990 [Burkholderia paludis]|uniref:hypothetical protein n=1 Tax=Burkholderia paludis TaxID=1506587 RepID=UPI0004DB7200|nr:hypothetical protein [Burkholderia paludis]KFG94912.1 hypothetical protein GQ56_0123990 [Burkholderia paludis]